MVSGQITNAMLRHHGIINKILSDFENIFENDTKKARNLFYLFRWNLEKHFFVEEVNIFPITNKNNKIESNQLKNLLKDHNDLREIVSNLNDELDEGRKPVTNILRELLFAHEGREVESFYPRLDARLSKEAAKNIIDRLEDVKIR